jgi:geranylgeranyl diphosphate synthase, type II
VSGAPPDVDATLAHYRTVTHDAMRKVLADGRPAAHLYDPVREYPERGGKGVRPALLLATCQAYGGSLEEAVGTAVSIEMLHNAFLVHDDIADGTASRRGRPTLHTMYGVGLALNAGDALASLALQVVRDDRGLSASVTHRLLDELLAVVRQTTEGQALDLGWHREGTIDLRIADYLMLAGKKTCWYTTVAPLRMGAIVGSRGTARLHALSRFGFLLGIAFQIRDDLLDVEATAEQLGKDVGTDLRERKRTLMVLHLLETACEADRASVVDWLSGRDGHCGRAGDELMLHLMQRYASLEVAREYGAALTAAAEAAFDEAFAELPRSEHLEFLLRMVPYMLGRPD